LSNVAEISQRDQGLLGAKRGEERGSDSMRLLQAALEQRARGAGARAATIGPEGGGGGRSDWSLGLSSKRRHVAAASRAMKRRAGIGSPFLPETRQGQGRVEI